jgi:lipopolysaccharide/colanic/teichoic acid biosynthesis glycosyltransferase
MHSVLERTDLTFVGYVAPAVMNTTGETTAPQAVMDGGTTLDALDRLGGLSRLDEVLVDHDIDTVVLAFQWADRQEFFGALDACHEHGVGAKVHREDADSVLTDGPAVEPLVDIDIEPWDIQDHIIKRGFDVLFAGSALLLLSPVIAGIALAIKLEGNGPILFSQQRTYLFGETFTVHKFRTLKPDPGNEVGTTFDGDRQTPLGEFLRTTHLDEIPQLWAILVGDMSVVGPRPAQTKIEDELEAEADQWRQRWFVKPGLTGLAQINGANSQDPETKLHYDLKYIRNQSFWYDLKIVVRQVWQVIGDVLSLRR